MTYLYGVQLHWSARVPSALGSPEDWTVLCGNSVSSCEIDGRSNRICWSRVPDQCL